MNDPSNEAERRLRLVALCALLCAALMLATIGLSAFLRLSQAAAAESAGGHAVAAARLAHRIVASVALLLAALMMMTVAGWRTWLRLPWALSVALLVVMLALALLGALAGASPAPAVVLGNLLGGFVALALCWRLAGAGSGASLPRGVRFLARVVVALLLAQVALGALVSGTGSARACTGWDDCWRSVEAGAAIQIAHRAGAWVALPAAALLGVVAWRRRAAAAALLLLAVTQAVLGPLAVAAGLPVAAVLAHNVVAALLLAVVATFV